MPGLQKPLLIALAAALSAAAAPVRAQSAAEAGADERSPTAIALESAEYENLIPGCTLSEPGVFVCEAIDQYQHCRTLMFSNMVHSCRAGNVFEGDFAEPRELAPGEYELSVDSSARIKVTRGERSLGRIRGKAGVVLEIDPPPSVEGASCEQRSRLLFFPTGPDGGISEVDDTAGCEEPLKFSFRPHEDDVLRAYDTCNAFAAWGMEIDDRIEVLAAGLYQMRSASPAFSVRYENDTALIAPYVTVEAPLTIDCRD